MICNQLETWKWNSEEAYKEVDFSIHGKEFRAFVKISKDKRTWTMLYQNESNPDDWFIRKEISSPELWQYGRPVLPQTYNHLLKKLIEKT